MESQNFPVGCCSKEEYEQTWDFLKKVEETDQEQTHKGIFLEYINVMKLFQSGSLDVVDVKDKVSTIFKNCDVLLDGFHRLLKNSYSNSGAIRGHDMMMKCPLGHDVIEIDVLNLERIKEFLKMLSTSRDCEELRGEFIKIFMRFQDHDNVKILKEEVDLIFRDHPLLKEEFRMILIDHDVLDDDQYDDKLVEADTYIEGLKSAIKFSAEGGDQEKPSVSVYGTMRRFYEQRRDGDCLARPIRSNITIKPKVHLTPGSGRFEESWEWPESAESDLSRNSDYPLENSD